MDSVIACETCGLVQQVEPVPKGAVAFCARCDSRLVHRKRNSRMRTFAFALAALILYFPSNFYPLVTGEYHGLHSETTIFKGIHSLFNDQQYFIAGLVFCTCILSPAL
jgi:paraquat-inducible protein A